MPIIVNTKDKNSAAEIVRKHSESVEQLVRLSDGHNNYKRFLSGKCIESCLDELNQEPQAINGNWCFLFTGQGAQTPKMMYDVYQSAPIFKKHLDHCFNLYQKIFGESLKEVVFSDSELINETKWTQPALFSVEYAMAMNWFEMGLTPNYVLGHSVGEYPAAVIAGIMSLDTGIELIGNRGILMQNITTKGAMAALMCDLEQAKTLILAEGSNLDVAGINSTKQTVISGDILAIERIIEIAKNHKIKARELTVSHAFHSSHMEPILEQYAEIASKHKYVLNSKCKLISNITGKPLEEAPNGEYWAKHIRSAVNFVDGIKFASNSTDNFIEVGPHPVLSTMGTKTVEKEHNWLASYNVKKGHSVYETSLGSLINAGIIVE